MPGISLNDAEMQELKSCLLNFVRRVTSIKRGNMERVLGEEIAILPEVVKLIICPAQCKACQCSADPVPTPPFEELLQRMSPETLRMLCKGHREQG